MAHDDFREALAGYALDLLGASERQALETHLQSCAPCREALAGLREVTAGLGVAAEPMSPPASLKARTMARAMGTDTVPAPPTVRASRAPLWMATAAAMVAIVAGAYAWSLHRQVNTLEATVAESWARAERASNDIEGLRTEAALFERALGVISAPDVLQVELWSQPAGINGAGRAFVSPSRGLVVNTEKLKALTGDFSYQLWARGLDGRSMVAVGPLRPTAVGTQTYVSKLPVALANGTELLVTVEASPDSVGPTSKPVLSGHVWWPLKKQE